MSSAWSATKPNRRLANRVRTAFRATLALAPGAEQIALDGVLSDAPFPPILQLAADSFGSLYRSALAYLCGAPFGSGPKHCRDQ